VSLTNPVILLEMIDSTNNWLALMKTSASAPSDTLNQEADTPADTVKGSYTFSHLQITGGKVLFSDKTLRYPFEYVLDNIKIESTPVAGTDKLSLTIAAGLNGTGTLDMKTTMSPSDFKNIDLALTIGQFRMKDMDAYFRHYFGFPVTGGIMNFKTENKIRPNSLNSDNSIYFRKFTLDKSLKIKTEYHIPLRLALGILSDKDGIIDLKAPVETKGEEIKVRNLGKIILKIIGNLFIKAAVSPFNLLSASYKVDPSKLQEIRLDLLEPSPDEKNLKSVDIIADILHKKPGLNLDVFYCSDHSEAIDSLAYLMALDDYLKNHKAGGLNGRKVADSTLTGFILSEVSSSGLKADTAIKDLCRNFIGTARLEAKLDSIKTVQIGFIKNYLNRDKEIPETRFNIYQVSPDTIKPSGKYPAFRTYFTAGS
jgi:hypothetical protein